MTNALKIKKLSRDNSSFEHSEEMSIGLIDEKKQMRPKTIESVDSSKSKDVDISDEKFLKEFDLKSEFVEKDVRIKGPSREDMEQAERTNVLVYRDNDEVETINPTRELKEIIKKDKIGIKSVKNKSKENLPSKVITDIEKRINRHFLEYNENDHVVENKEAKDKKKTKNKIVEENLQKNNVLKLKTKNGPDLEVSNDSLPKNKYNEDKLNCNEEHLFEHDEQINENKTSKDIQFNKFFKEPAQNETDNDGKVDKKLTYLKQTLTRKKNKLHNGFYYRVKDHMELFKIGSFFLSDFKNGLKHFSFNSGNLKEDQEKTVFGISSFFSYHTDVKQLIIGNQLKETFYYDYVQNYGPREMQVFDEDVYLTFQVGKGFNYLEFYELGNVERKIRNYDFEDFLHEFCANYDLIFWDLPSIEIMDGRKEFFSPIMRMLDNVSFIVKGNKTKMTDIEKIVTYFQKYQIKIKGLLFSSPEKEKK